MGNFAVKNDERFIKNDELCSNLGEERKNSRPSSWAVRRKKKHRKKEKEEEETCARGGGKELKWSECERKMKNLVKPRDSETRRRRHNLVHVVFGFRFYFQTVSQPRVSPAAATATDTVGCERWKTYVEWTSTCCEDQSSSGMYYSVVSHNPCFKHINSLRRSLWNGQSHPTASARPWRRLYSAYSHRVIC